MGITNAESNEAPRKEKKKQRQNPLKHHNYQGFLDHMEKEVQPLEVIQAWQVMSILVELH